MTPGASTLPRRRAAAPVRVARHGLQHRPPRGRTGPPWARLPRPGVGHPAVLPRRLRRVRRVQLRRPRRERVLHGAPHADHPRPRGRGPPQRPAGQRGPVRPDDRPEHPGRRRHGRARSSARCTRSSACSSWAWPRSPRPGAPSAPTGAGRRPSARRAVRRAPPTTARGGARARGQSSSVSCVATSARASCGCCTQNVASASPAPTIACASASVATVGSRSTSLATVAAMRACSSTSRRPGAAAPLASRCRTSHASRCSSTKPEEAPGPRPRAARAARAGGRPRRGARRAAARRAPATRRRAPPWTRSAGRGPACRRPRRAAMASIEAAWNPDAAKARSAASRICARRSGLRPARGRARELGADADIGLDCYRRVRNPARGTTVLARNSAPAPPRPAAGVRGAGALRVRPARPQPPAHDPTRTDR